MKRKVLLIGWDAADWKVITPLMEAGRMPALQRLVASGVSGRMATLDPPLSPMLWTSIATGKRPYKHGIHGFTEPDGQGGIRPIYQTNRSCKAIWNILTQHQHKTHVVGWWPSHPAEPINGIMISNFYQRAPDLNPDTPWPLKKGTIHPVEKEALFADLRVHPSTITADIIAGFVPELHRVDQSRDGGLAAIARNLGDCTSIHSAANHILETEEWDFMAVYYDAIDHFCHGFMKYHPPRRDHIPVQDYELYKDVVNSAYEFHDLMLARLLELAGEDTTVILISDHGFHPNHNRPKVIPKEPTGPAAEHSPFGIFVMKGPGIRQGEQLMGASLLDVAPTLLHLFGLPAGADMDGKVLVHAFAQEQTVKTIPSWELVPGADGRHSLGNEPTAEENAAELRQLIELGYIADPGQNQELAIKSTLAENQFNLARAYLNGQQWEPGIALLDTLWRENPTALRYGSYLANACMTVGKFRQAREVVNQIREQTDRETPQLDLLEATLLLAEERPVKALDLLKKVEQEAGNQPQLRMRLANVYLELNRLDLAEATLLTALEADPEEVGSWYTLGVCRFRNTNYIGAVEAFLKSIGLLYYHPQAHYYLGETLLAMQRYEEAIQAFDVCLRIAPAMNMARERIISIYLQYLDQPGKAEKYMLDFDQAVKGEIVIVSGLPRSGTSMMMQMLEAGGIPLFTDRERQADESNPKGYYEHEAVKNLAKNKAWLPEAKDKAVKVIAQLLPELPLHWHYKVIFMERDVLEVVSSQQKMLVRNGKAGHKDPYTLAQTYTTELARLKDWADTQPHVDVLYIPYSEVVDLPFEAAIRVSAFLGGKADPEAMAQAVDPRLRRERNEGRVALWRDTPPA